jgi:hypothetical protein
MSVAGTVGRLVTEFPRARPAVCFRPMPELAHPRLLQGLLVVDLAQRMELVGMDHGYSPLCRVSRLGYVLGTA